MVTFRVGLVGLTLALAACGSRHEETRWTLELACAGERATRPTWATLLVRVRSSDGGAPRSPLALDLGGPGFARSLTLPAGKSVHAVELPWVDIPGGSQVVARATIEGTALEATCLAETVTAKLALAARSPCPPLLPGTPRDPGCTAELSWAPVDGAVEYRAAVADSWANDTLGEVRTHGTSVVLPGAPLGLATVSAWPFDPDAIEGPLPAPRVVHARALVSTSAAVGGFALAGPGDFVDGEVTVVIPAAQRSLLAVALVNPGNAMEVGVVASGLETMPEGSARSAEPAPVGRPTLPRSFAARAMPPVVPSGPPAVGDRRSFCTPDYEAGTWVRTPCTAAHVSRTAVFWIADARRDSVAALEEKEGNKQR